MNHILKQAAKGIKMIKLEKHGTQEFASNKIPKLVLPFQIGQVLVID